MNKLAVMAVLVLVSAGAFAQYDPAKEDLANCRWRRTGQPMSAKICAQFRAETGYSNPPSPPPATPEAVTSRNEEAEQREARWADERKAKRRAEEEAAVQKLEADRKAKEDADRRTVEAFERQERLERRAAAERMRILKDKCGDDYRSPKIGMTIKRAQECVGRFRLVAQVNVGGTVISTYRTETMSLETERGHIIAWSGY